MNFVEVLDVVSDFIFCLIFFIAILVLIVETIRQVITGEAWKNKEEPDEYLERLDKLQETVELLASKHLDGEAMKELQEMSSDADEIGCDGRCINCDYFNHLGCTREDKL